MLAVPVLKAVSVPSVDMSGLHRYLVGQQPHNEAIISHDISVFNELRNSAVSFTEVSDVAVQQLLTYCHQLKSFSPRFVGVESELNLVFTWTDGFAATKNASVSSLYFEWACCIWNLAAFESLRGARVDRTSEEGIRTANRHFQQSAGYFEFIRTNILPHIKIQTIPSLSEDSLLMVKNLMLAQAQLCFYEKAVKDKKKDLMKSAIIAKLAAQTFSFYALACTSCKTGVLGPLLDVSWSAITDFQSKCFHGASEYWQALASKEVALSKGTGYGEEVARYRRAENYVSQALAVGRKHNIAPSLPQGAEGLLAAITANKKTAEYDLTTIYMETVPSDGSLVEVVPVAMVRPSSIPDLPNANPERLFKYVVPKELIESSHKFQEEVNAIFVAAQVDADNATNVGRVTLSSVGLPGSLEAIKSEVPLPEPLWNKIQRVQGMGGFDRLSGLFDDLQAGARRALSTMASIDDSLQREERVDAEFRSRYPDWNGPPSISLNIDTKNNYQRMRDAYSNAQSSDEIIRRELQDVSITEGLKLLSQSKEQLLKLFPQEEPNLLDFDESAGDVSARSTAAFGPDAVKLEERLHEMAELIETRTSALEGIRKVTEMDFIELVSNNMGGVGVSANTGLGSGKIGADTTTTTDASAGLQGMFDQHLASCREWRETITKGTAQQEALLNEILHLNTSFLKSREMSPLAIKTNEVIQRLEQNIAKYFSLHSQISAGVTFYSNLQSKLTTLLQSSDDLAYTQQWQRSEFEASRTTAYQRTSQETADHEYAMKLAGMLNTEAAAPISSTAATAAPVTGAWKPPPPPAKPAKPATIAGSGLPNPSEVYYGTPVQGPPPNARAATPSSAVGVPVPNYVSQATAGAAPQPVSMPSSGQISYSTTASMQQPSPYAPQPSNAYQYTHQVPQPQPQVHYQPPLTAQQQQYVQPSNPHQQQNPNLFGAQSVAAPTQQSYNPYGAIAALPAPQPAQSYPPPLYQPRQTATGGYVYNTSSPPLQQQHQAHVGQSYPQQPQPQLYQQQPQSYPLQPQPQYHQQQMQAVPVPMSAEEFQRKVSALCEMGFPQDAVIHALNANNGNDEAALNSLLSGSSSAPAANAATVPPPATTTTGKPSGLFGKIWGK